MDCFLGSGDGALLGGQAVLLLFQRLGIRFRTAFQLLAQLPDSCPGGSQFFLAPAQRGLRGGQRVFQVLQMELQRLLFFFGGGFIRVGQLFPQSGDLLFQLLRRGAKGCDPLLGCGQSDLRIGKGSFLLRDQRIQGFFSDDFCFRIRQLCIQVLDPRGQFLCLTGRGSLRALQCRAGQKCADLLQQRRFGGGDYCLLLAGGKTCFLRCFLCGIIGLLRFFDLRFRGCVF